MPRGLVTARRAVLWSGLVGSLVFVNAVPLGFALDDDQMLRLNPVVVEGRIGEAMTGPYWRIEPEWGLLYRPLTLASFALEWGLWDGAPEAFHAVNVVAHGVVTALVAGLLLVVLPPGAALAGALIFAVHPVHVEAVANVVGRSELYAAGAFLVGVLAFLRRPVSAGGGAARLLVVLAAYAVGLGSKEIAVTLPAVLLLLAVHPATRRDGDGPEPRRPAADFPLFLGLGAVLAFYLVLRTSVLGSPVGEELPAELVGTTPVQRIGTALTLWPQYARLMVFPLDLVADYGPGVLRVPSGPGPDVVGGALVLGGLVALAVVTRTRAPAVSLGLAWFMVTVLPVAHLGVHAGVLLAERTLYLPSVGLALVAGGLVRVAEERGVGRRPVAGALAVVLVLLTVRTVTRTPVWDSTFTLFRDLARSHPESHRALRLYGDVLFTSGELERSARAFGEAAAVHPHRYLVLLEAGAAHMRAGEPERATELLERAVGVAPRRRSAYRLLAEARLEAGRGREALRTAATGLARAGSDPGLWAALSEAWVLLGDLPAAVRARRAAVGADPASAFDWRRLSELLRLTGDSAAAEDALERARELEEGAAPGGPGVGGRATPGSGGAR